ncbi:hypothetical protein OHA27_36785 [Streptomyces sp. NBC_01619]|nr:hypothetical protein [Streptomyces sp. NBC_01619]MCX4515728.1 hypothetical protein [Streptomyces sp. NBC_01619]
MDPYPALGTTEPAAAALASSTSPDDGWSASTSSTVTRVRVGL